MQKVIVTGANGFVGQHLVKELSEHDLSVMGVGGPQGATGKLPFVAEYVVMDLTDKDAVNKLDFSGVDGVIHLAGLAAVGPSFDDPDTYTATNVGIQANIFEAALSQNAKPRFLIISSGTVYDSTAPLPLDESAPTAPGSPYAASKLGQEQAARDYGSRGLDCIIARPFNHIGPGQNPGFIVPDIARQIIAFEKGETKELLVGNLDAQRDYTDVRDIVRAYRLLLEKGATGETYNICSGQPVSGHDIVAGLLAAAGIDIPIQTDPAKARPSDSPVFYGDNRKLAAATSWQPKIPLETTLTDVITDWRGRDDRAS